MVLRGKAIAPFLLASLTISFASQAQQPQQPGYPQPQPYPQQPPPQAYPQQQPPAQGYPQQYPQQQLPPQGYPQQQYPQQQPPPQGYPQQQYPQQQPPPQQAYPPPQQYPQQPPAGYPQQYPPQQLPPPQGYPQQYPPQQYPPQQLPPPGYVQPPPPGPMSPPVPSGKRDDGEMVFLYTTSIAWGLGSGIWIDGLAGVNDPGIAFITPLALGAAAPIALYAWDNYDPLDRGVPSSIATGLTLGAIEGIAISGTQWQNTGNGGPSTWSFQGQSSLTWAFSTVGGVGGYFFGEYLKPDPRSLSFIVSGAGWGAMSGLLIGAGAESPTWCNGCSNPTPPQSFGDGASVGGLVGYNAGIVATGVLSLAGYVPSWRTQQAMWLGYLIGTLGGSLVYLFYIGQPDVHHGMIANGVGGLAGVGVAAAVAGNMKDTAKAWVPPFQIGLAPTPYGGAALAAFGSW